MTKRERDGDEERDSGSSHEVVNFYDVITRLVKFTQQLVSLLRQATGFSFMNMSSLWKQPWNCDWDWDCDCESRRSRVESCELYLQPEFLLLLRHL